MADIAEALCLTEDTDWERIARRIGGTLRNREIADSGDYDTVLEIPVGVPKTDDRQVQGCCPMGCGHTLFLAAGGYITCSYVHCPCPDAVATILEDADPRHVVVLDDTGFTVRHPLRERLGDELEHCPLHEYLASIDGPPHVPGRYWLTGQPGNLKWEPAPLPETSRE